ncbi:TniQ family protein [Streptomyces hyaluromycini]|uniref:TniQ family protein n=1 Tax=Streptomyces hyaluromycini TaxID=1377993 RepID=UPI000B5C49CB|nr:TniQ family protein [Streptomyces hyaluromycini]
MRHRPLPRSLNPTPGEALPSFLLRLSYRLSVKPLDLAEHCGLLGASRVTFPSRHLVQLGPETADALARSSRLSVAEVHDLTLGRQAPGFPPLRLNYLGRKRTFETIVAEGWSFTRFSRYCPECLSNPEHGSMTSSWPGFWRLPMAFACPRHHRYLDWRCPACGNPAFSAGITAAGRWRPAQLIPNPTTVLHPAQCRSRIGDDDHINRPPPACGHRLDHHMSPVIRPSLDVLHLQQELLDLAMDPTGLHQAVSGSEQFADLRAAMLLICGTWPVTAQLFPRAAKLDAIDTDIDQRLRRLTARQKKVTHVARALDTPPADSVACAALMLLARHILDGPDRAERIDALLSRCTRQWPGRPKLLRLEPHCSAGLRTALRPRLDALRPVSADFLAFFPQTATHQGELDAATIPQHLPGAWMEPLQPLGAPIHPLRRDAAIRLVQMAHGGTRRQAALYLGFTAAVSHNTSAQLRSWQSADDNARQYADTLGGLASQLAATDSPVNYEHRRAHLQSWVLPQDDWKKIIEMVVQQLEPAQRHRIRWDRARHLAASAIIWAQVTQGDWQWSPMLRNGPNIGSVEIKRARFGAYELTLPVFPSREPGRLARLLHNALLEHADKLAKQIDSERPQRTAVTSSFTTDPKPL